MISRSAMRQAPGLEEDRVGHRDLAGVVQQEAELDLGVVAEAHAVDVGELQPVGGDALGVAAGVGVARLDGARERAHGEHVGLPQLLGAGTLLLEGLAQVGGVALELLLLGGGLARAHGELGLELCNPLLQLLLRTHRHHLPPAVGRLPSAERSASTA